MSNVEPLIASQLGQMLPLPDDRRADWIDVLRRAGVDGAGGVWHLGLALTGRRRWRMTPERKTLSGRVFRRPRSL